jgi:hypothetical protein
MTNYEWLKELSIEEMAVFLANETMRMAKPLFDLMGCGIHEQVIVAKRLEWLKSDAE